MYALNNNLAMYIQLGTFNSFYYDLMMFDILVIEMDPASYQVLGNMKILTTAFLYRIIMQR